MPSYDYVCQDCEEPFEIHASISEYSKGMKPRCPNCGSRKAIRTFTSFNILAGSKAEAGARAGAACCPSPGLGCRK